MPETAQGLRSSRPRTGEPNATFGCTEASTPAWPRFHVHSIHASVGPSPDEATTATWDYQSNQQYSITAVTTSSGSVAERYAYTAYGQPTILDGSGSVLSSSAINNRYTYTGREWDQTLGLYHFRARWMSGLAGRFMGRDPIGFEGSEWGLYEFFDGNALSGSDPLGEDWHHLFPFEFDDWFKANGIDIDDPRWGWELDPGHHRELHSAGWNEEWREFFSRYPNKNAIPQRDIITQLNRMKGSPKYMGILSKGTAVTKRYPYGYIRRNKGKIPGAKGKLAKMIGFLGPILIAGNACAGGCSSEQSNLENALQRFSAGQNQSNCQDVLFSLHAFLSCSGVDDLPNGIQLYQGVIQICTQYP